MRGSDSRSDSAPDPTPRHNAAAGPRPARTNELTWPARGPVPGAAQRRGPLGTRARPSAGQAPPPGAGRPHPAAPGGRGGSARGLSPAAPAGSPVWPAAVFWKVTKPLIAGGVSGGFKCRF